MFSLRETGATLGKHGRRQGDRGRRWGNMVDAWETGAELQVPLFINTGDKLKVDSRDGSYLGRVNA